MAERIDLLIIDPQVSFCDPEKGELYVPGAENDMQNVANMIDRFGKKINKIHVTLDCHHKIDIAHPLMWKNKQGENPQPFTIITAQDIQNNKWTPIFPNLKQRFIDYCNKLAQAGKYQLCIWAEHCKIASQGNMVLPILYDSLEKWEELKCNNVDFVTKGSNPYTEHYSGICAEIPLSDDPSTQLNTAFLQTLIESDKILICGEAKSHCLKFTTENIISEFKDSELIKKIILLEDGTSSVISPFVDFPAISEQFVKDNMAKGMQVAKTTDF